jgi:hypothetical protein
MTALKKISMSKQIAEYIRTNPNAKPAEVAAALKTSVSYVYVVTSKMKSKSKKTKPTPAQRAEAIRLKMAKIEGSEKMVRVFTGTSDQSITAHIDQITNLTPEQKERLIANLGQPRIRMGDKWQPPALLPVPDSVNHPTHYKVGGIETIDFIEAKGFSYNLGNVVKYITRADHKGNLQEDLLKARWYLNREIAKLSGAKT